MGINLIHKIQVRLGLVKPKQIARWMFKNDEWEHGLFNIVMLYFYYTDSSKAVRWVYIKNLSLFDDEYVKKVPAIKIAIDDWVKFHSLPSDAIVVEKNLARVVAEVKEK